MNASLLYKTLSKAGSYSDITGPPLWIAYHLKNWDKYVVDTGFKMDLQRICLSEVDALFIRFAFYQEPENTFLFQKHPEYSKEVCSYCRTLNWPIF